MSCLSFAPLPLPDRESKPFRIGSGSLRQGLEGKRAAGLLADTIEARRTRIRHHAATVPDMSWARITVGPRRDQDLPEHPYVCDCRCRCHSSSALTATGAAPGSCGLRMNLDTLDCERGCRSAHILASECQLDETRGGAHL